MARKRINPPTDLEWAFLHDQPLDGPDVDTSRRWELTSNITIGSGEPAAELLWRQWGGEVLKGWIVDHPGTRPRCWWLFETGEPRRRLGGVGEEPQSHVQFYVLGLPQCWRGLDSKDPPLFESQAAYLDRHGLLTDAERRRLPADAFLPEPLIFDESERTV